MRVPGQLAGVGRGGSFAAEKRKVYARAQWAVPEAPVLTFNSNGCLGVDVNAWGVSLAYCQRDGNKAGKGQPPPQSQSPPQPFFRDRPIDWTGSSEQSVQHIRVAAKEIVEQAGLLGCPLALELLDFADKKIQLRYEASPKAAFAIARKAVLSRGKDVKRGKRPEGWVDLHAKPEKLDSFGSNARLASRTIVRKIEKKVAKAVVMKVVKQGGPAQTPGFSPGRRSMPPARGSAERRLSLALGSDRGLWTHRLKASAESGEQGSKPPAQAARRKLGKGGGAGGIGLPSGSLELGESRISTD